MWLPYNKTKQVGAHIVQNHQTHEEISHPVWELSETTKNRFISKVIQILKISGAEYKIIVCKLLREIKVGITEINMR